MPYLYSSSVKFESNLRKIKKRNKILFERVIRKIEEILDQPEIYKPLKYDLAGSRRVHFGSQVMTFEIKGNTIKFLEIEHHDKVYRR